MPKKSNLTQRKKRALFRASHRGFREMDILLGAFVTAQISAFTQADMDALENLMEAADWDLYNWIMGAAPVPADYDSALFARLKAFHQSTGLSALS